MVLDLREPKGDLAARIQWIGETQSPVALICLYENYSQVMAHEELLHWVDDFIVPDALGEGELSARMKRSILRPQKDLERVRDQELLTALLGKIPDSIYF